MRLFGRKSPAKATVAKDEEATPYVAAEARGERRTRVPKTSQTSYVADEDGDDQPYTRRGHLFFNRYCDMRIATIAINSLNIALRIICLVTQYTWGELYPTSTDYCSIILSAIAIFGAINYEHLVTGVATVGLACIAVTRMVWGAAWYGIVFDLLLLYPSAMLTYEIYQAIITEDTYEREEYIDPQILEQVEKIKGQIPCMTSGDEDNA